MMITTLPAESRLGGFNVIKLECANAFLYLQSTPGTSDDVYNTIFSLSSKSAEDTHTMHAYSCSPGLFSTVKFLVDPGSRILSVESFLGANEPRQDVSTDIHGVVQPYRVQVVCYIDTLHRTGLEQGGQNIRSQAN